uniref:Uncharacterized protein n=1 Tax=Arundo donax TaxID=35708 RepID=A0A0A8YT08_ARUDO
MINDSCIIVTNICDIGEFSISHDIRCMILTSYFS